MQISIVGGGYVGLVTAACLARMDHVVRILEVSPTRVSALRAGRTPFYEPGLQELLSEAVESGSLRASDDAEDSLAAADLVMICVGTPLADDGAADLSQIASACATIREHVPEATVVVRSTLPIGSTAGLREWLGRSCMDGVVTNPEFLRQGTAVRDFQRPTRIVIGTEDGTENQAARAVRKLYRPLDAPVLVTDYATAEMIKNVANAFLATKLSFINEVADLCEAYGANVETVVTGIGYDPRIGSGYLRPGIGFGGSCLPKELANLVRLGQWKGLAMPLLESAGRVNDTRASRIADRLELATSGLRDRRVAILGLSFKPDTDDLRYSPSLALATRLLERGARVIAHDPVVPLHATSDVVGLERAADAESAIDDAELVVLATEWRQYRDLPWAELRARASDPLLFDGRNALDHIRLRKAGWRVLAIGQAFAE